MYIVMIKGVAVQCQTPQEAIRLVNEVASGETRDTGRKRNGDKIEENKADVWRERARAAIILLAKGGTDGVDAVQIAKAAGLKSSKGSSPLVKAIATELAGIDGIGDEGRVIRKRTKNGKRWSLSSRVLAELAKVRAVK